MRQDSGKKIRTIIVVMATAASSQLGCMLDATDDTETVRSELSASSPADRAALALRWAPVHYQDVDPTGSHALGGASDYITRFDYDGDLNARNNWDNLGNAAFPKSAHGYFSVAETSTHWFIIYMFFHPRDWVDNIFGSEHENDSEGLLLTVARDGSTYGALKSAVTVAHSDFWSYLAPGVTWTSNRESVDGTLQMAAFAGDTHPVTAQEAKGHGLRARPHYDIIGEGVVYFPSLATAEVPSSTNDRDVLYKLVDIFEPGGLWDNRALPSLFASAISFAGDRTGGCGQGTFGGCSLNSANPPWAWDDTNDQIARGAMATDPVGLVTNYFIVTEPVSPTYTFNPYLM
jgi:hypothetical protein